MPGKMKDEYGGTAIYVFIGLKSKMYSILDVNNYEKSAHKGHNLSIKFDNYKDTLFNKKVFGHLMRGIKSKDHNITTYEKNKISTSWYDDKRYILLDGINTLPYGNKDILKNE